MAANVTVVIVNYRTPKLTMECLAALRGERDLLPGMRAIVVEGGSGDNSTAQLAEETSRSDYQDWVSFMPLSINGGFGWANNQAILTLARHNELSEFIHLLNPDTQIKKGAVANLARDLSANPRCGVAGSQLLDAQGRRSASAFRFPSAAREFVTSAQSEALGRLAGIGSTVIETDESSEVDWVTGASAMFRSAALRDTGLFDDGFFLYFEEVELMHRMHEHGWTVRHVPDSRVVHHEASSTGTVAASRMPVYWYQSRRRYFVLTRGQWSAICADLAWFGGRAIAMLKRVVRGDQTQGSVHGSDLLKVPRKVGPASVPHLGDVPGTPPSWMVRA